MLKKKFPQLIEQWKTMDRTTRDQQTAALAFYDEHVFPFVKETFLSKPTNRPQQNYFGLILPVGWSPEPLILSILAIQPKRVAFLHTPETRHHLARIQQETGLTLDQIYMREVDGSNVTEIYREIMKLYNDWGQPANQIAIDITGGKKSMVSGAAMAGAVLGADVYYVDNESFLREHGKPEPGSEFLSRLQNPYHVFGDLDVQKAAEFYNRHDYAGASAVFDQLKKKVHDANHAEIYQAYQHLCATYETWDNLNIGRAKRELDRLLRLDRLATLDGLARLRELQPRLVEQRKALDTLQRILNKPQLAVEAPDGFHVAFTLYYNALRRETQAQLDIACLILYRLLEWIGEYRLAEHGINNTQEPNYAALDDEKALFVRYGERRKAVFGKMNRTALPSPIGLVDAFLLLAACDDPIVKNLDWSAFRSQIETRNQSIYAHGTRLINDDNFKAFHSLVKERFQLAQDLAGIDAKTFQTQHEFIKPAPFG